jgi:hypothetical protein
MSRDSMFPAVKPPPASVRFNNPGAMYPGPSAKKFGTTGTHTIGGGHKIAAFDNPVNGAAAQFDLLSRKYAGMRMGDAINMWSGGNFSPEYSSYIESKTGVSPSTVLTPELIANPSFAIPFAKASAEWESGLTKAGYPLSDDQWGSAHRMALGGAVPQQGEDEMQRTNVAMNGSISGGRPPAQLPAPMALGGQQPWVNPDTGAPVTAGDPGQFIETDVKAKRAKAYADLLNGVAYQDAPITHWADGASRAMAALLGGYSGKKQDEGEVEARNAHMDMLPDASPLERMILASGDKNATSSVLSSRVRGSEKTDLQKNFEYAKQDGYAGSFEDFKRNGGIGSRPTSIQELEYEKANGYPEGYFAKQRADEKIAAKGEDKGRDLNAKQLSDVLKAGTELQNVTRYATTYKDGYGGYGVGSEDLAQFEQQYAAKFPKSSGEQRVAASNWWRDYKRNSEIIERHGLFGSALTASEQAQWSAADINPSLSDQAIKSSIERRNKIVREKAKRYVQLMRAEGYNEESVLIGLGVSSIDDLTVDSPAVAGGTPPPPAAAAGGAPAAAAAIPVPTDMPPETLQGLKAGKGVNINGVLHRLNAQGLLEQVQ